jgi:ABC-type nitrate/sulfonate/bicarbonate transport system permease component
MSSDTHWLHFRRLIDRVLPPTIILVVLLIVWQVSVRILDLPPWLLPAPSDIGARFGRTNSLGYHTGMTVLEAFSGFVIAAVFGIGLSGGIVHSRFLERGLLPYIIVSNAIPIIAIMPLLTIWFGFGIVPKIAICAIISFFPIVTNTTRGLRSADYRVIEFMRSINATPVQVFLKVQLPSCVPICCSWRSRSWRYWVSSHSPCLDGWSAGSRADKKRKRSSDVSIDYHPECTHFGGFCIRAAVLWPGRDQGRADL